MAMFFYLRPSSGHVDHKGSEFTAEVVGVKIEERLSRDEIAERFSVTPSSPTFLECRNLQTTSRQQKGITAILEHEKDTYRYLIIHKMDYTRDLMLAFVWKNWASMWSDSTITPSFYHESDAFTLANWQNHFDYLAFSIKDNPFYFVNQVTGAEKRFYNLSKGILDNGLGGDHKVQCSRDGPDIRTCPPLDPETVARASQGFPINENLKIRNQNVDTGRISYFSTHAKKSSTSKNKPRSKELPKFLSYNAETYNDVQCTHVFFVACKISDALGILHGSSRRQSATLKDNMFVAPYVDGKTKILNKTNRDFALLSKETTQELYRQFGCGTKSFLEYNKFLDDNRIDVVNQTIVSYDADNPTFICLVKEDDMREAVEKHPDMYTYDDDKYCYLYKGNIDHSKLPGVLLAAWIIDPDYHAVPVTPDMANLIRSTVSDGYGNRLGVQVKGVNLYLGMKQSRMSNASPCTGPGSILDHQYY